MDIFTKKKRSEIMGRIRSKWTTPELFAHGILKGNKIEHKMHFNITGKPDIFIHEAMKSKAIFIDGCFWHGHKCCKVPKSKFWQDKIGANKKRDRRTTKTLRKAGLDVVRIWECRLTREKILEAACA